MPEESEMKMNNIVLIFRDAAIAGVAATVYGQFTCAVYNLAAIPVSVPNFDCQEMSLRNTAISMAVIAAARTCLIWRNHSIGKRNEADHPKANGSRPTLPQP